MSYIGNTLQTAFPSYLNIDDISGSFNGVTTSFALTVGGVAPVPAPTSSNQCLISVGGVVQRPDDTGTEGFRLSGGNIVFSSAPGTGEDFFGVVLAGADYLNVGVNFPSGTAANPSITFDTDLDTGLYNSAANELSFTTAGVNKLTLNSSGDVVITDKISHLGDTNTAIRFPAADTVSIETDGNERARVDSAGRLLLGTSSSRNVASGTNGIFQIEQISTAVSQSIVCNTNTSTGAIVSLGKSRGTTAGSSTIVQDGDELGSIRFAGADGTDLETQAANITCYVDGTPGANDMPGRLVFSTTADSASSPTERMRITNEGKILCGTTTTYGRIHATDHGFNPESTTWLEAAFVGSGGFGGGIALLDGSQGYSIYCKDNGNDLFIQGHTSLTGSATGGVQLNNRATSWTSASDERDKENLIPITNAVDKIKTLRTVTGNYHWAPETSCAFLIAQDVQQVLPEAVSILNKEAEGDDQRLGLAYSQTIPLLTAALKEAIAKIETLEQRLSDAGIA